eukprot:g561.t1
MPNLPPSTKEKRNWGGAWGAVVTPEHPEGAVIKHAKASMWQGHRFSGGVLKLKSEFDAKTELATNPYLLGLIKARKDEQAALKQQERASDDNELVTCLGGEIRMLALVALLCWSGYDAAPACLRTGSVSIGGSRIGACIDGRTGVVEKVWRTSDNTSMDVSIGTALLSSCVATAANVSSASASGGLNVETTWRCNASKYHLKETVVAISETFREDNRGTLPAIEWNCSVSSTEAFPFTTEIIDTVALTAPSPNAKIWAAATDGGRLESDFSTLQPRALTSFAAGTSTRVYYGRDQWSANGRGTVALPKPTQLDSSDWFRAENIVACPYPTCRESELVNLTHGNSDPVAYCWRPALGWFIEREQPAMTVHPSVNKSAIDGACSFADYRGESDNRSFSAAVGKRGADGTTYATKLHAMNYQVNWEVSANWGESHGHFMPFNLSTGTPFAPSEQWVSCIGAPNFTKAYGPTCGGNAVAKDPSCYHYPTTCFGVSYDHLRSWYEDFSSFGFTTLMYGNYWLYMRKHLNGSIFRRWTDESGEDPNSVIASGMEGAVLIDAGRPEYEMHLRNMTSWMLRLIPESAGLAFDGTGWQGLVDLKGDDGRTYIELHEPGETGGPVKVGRAVHSQVTSKLSIQRVIGELLHSKGRAHFWNPYAPRADFMQHTDGIFAEDSYEDERMHLLALLGAGGKPVLSWNHGCDIRAMKQCTRYQDSNNNEQLLHRLLYWGLQPMVPFSRNDHGKEHIVSEHSNDTITFVNYGPLFRAIRGRRWFLAAHAVQVTKGEAQANVFLTRNGIGVPVVLGAPFSLVSITIRGLEWPANKTVVTRLSLAGLDRRGSLVLSGQNGGDELHFINLDRRTDRLAAVQAQEPKLLGASLHRFPGVDGRAEQAALSKLASLFEGNDFRNAVGVTGCAVSHLLLWNHLLESCGLDRMVIMEDDSKLTDHFAEWPAKLARIEALDPEWDIIYLGMFNAEGIGLSTDIDRYLNHDDERLDGGTIIKFGEERRVELSGAFGYCLSRRGALKLLALAQTQNIKRAVDMFMIDAFQYGLHGYLLHPGMIEAVAWSAGGENEDTDIQQEVFAVQHAREGESCRLLSFQEKSIGVFLGDRLEGGATVVVEQLVRRGASDLQGVNVGDRVSTVRSEEVFTAKQAVDLLREPTRPVPVLICRAEERSEL